MKPSSNRRRRAGILAVAALTAACTASPPARHADPAPELACTTLPIASAPAAGASGQRSRLDLPPVPGGLGDVAARSPSSALAVGSTVPTPGHLRALVALWNGAVWRTLSNRALPPESELDAVALFPGGAWAAGTKGMAEHGRVFGPLMVRVTGTTVRQVPVPVRSYSSSLEDVAATSAAVGFTYTIPLILHWNGTAWTRAPLPATAGRRALLDVAATSANDVWAVGSAMILHWNGLRWTCALSPDDLAAVSTSSADNAWAVGSSSDSTRAVALHWNGHTWKQVMTPHPGPDNVRQGVAVISPSGAAWAVGGTDTGTLMLHWNGTAWH